MTFLVILLSISAGALFYLATGNVVEIAGFRIYVLAYMAGLSVAVVFAALSRNRRCWAGAAVLVGNFVATHLAWQSSDPVLVHAAADIATAGYFMLAGQTRWELGIGFLFLGSVGIGVLTMLGVIPDAGKRSGGFIALSHPDAVALLGHAANIVLGLGAGDSGARVRALFRTRPRLAVARGQVFAALWSLAVKRASG